MYSVLWHETWHSKQLPRQIARARINIACNNFYSRPKTLPSVNELNLNILFNFFYHILFTFLSFHLWDQSAVKNTPSLKQSIGISVLAEYIMTVYCNLVFACVIYF